MYRVKSITRREGDTWDWVLGFGQHDIEVSVLTPGATKRSMYERASRKCRSLNKQFDMRDELAKLHGKRRTKKTRNTYQSRMRNWSVLG